MKGRRPAALCISREPALHATADVRGVSNWRQGCAARFALTWLARCDAIESDLDIVEPRQADMEQGAGCCSMPGGRLDDIEMDAVARGALLRPIFGASTTRDHAQDGQLRVAAGASRANR
jgi:hypothetical protein